MEDLKQTYPDSLPYHKGGKLEVIPRTRVENEHDLSLAYSPGVAVPCKEIQKDPNMAYEYTSKGNLVAVFSNLTTDFGFCGICGLSGQPIIGGEGGLV
ncbi:hypothetical protein [Helicobacter pullorum]